MPDTGLDRVTMGGVLVTLAHWPQPPRPTLMERRCWVTCTAGRSHRDRVRRFWVTYTASLLPLLGVVETNPQQRWERHRTTSYLYPSPGVTEHTGHYLAHVPWKALGSAGRARPFN